jgi:uncharacterized protein (DUF2147 family)
MKKTHACFFILIAILSYTVTFANETYKANSATGKWMSVDSKTQQPTGIIEISEHDGILYGKIIAGFGVDPIKYCHNCPGSLKDTPVIGLTFLWGFSPQTNNTWTNGRILDPHGGKIYRGTLKLTEHGKKLQLRGYWGIFFQTETWIRKE